ncbi:MAG TPA: DNA polymerase I, partial [Gammaproteobacteria bacterium]|nr:DNA polymerase I [Gammaproteobacteria bacterium]
RPDQIIDYLTLVGDAVDNIPGVNKVGPKTAAKWLDEYGSLDAIIEHADDFKGKVGEYLRESLERLPLSRQLVTLKCDIDLGLQPEDLVTTGPDHHKIRQHYERWQFRSLLDALDTGRNKTEDGENAGVNTGQHADCDYETIMQQADLDKWLQTLKQAGLFAFDTETTSLNYAEAVIVGLSFATGPGRAAYVPLAHDYEGAPFQLDRDEVLQQLRSLLEDDSRAKVGHNLKYDMNVLHNHGIALRGCRHDSMLESYVLNSTASRHDMDTLAEKHLHKKTIHFEDVAGKGAKQVGFNQVTVEHAAPYAAEDADITLQLHNHFWPQLVKNQGLKMLYENIEIPLLPVLSRMECYGVMIDAGLLQLQSRQLTEVMQEIEQTIYAEAGETFNIGSPKQIQAILYDKMDLPVLAKTPGGQPSTAESVLQELAADYELPKLILAHRSLSKLKSTYTDKLPDLINSKTGRIHTSYHQAVAATGRLSSSDPNLQNIPVRTEQGRRIRKAFIAPEGYSLLAADYSQIELRIMAHLSGDRRLLDAFAQGEDIHRLTASEVFGTSLNKVSQEQRRAAKAINFGLIYGMSAFGLAKQLAISRKEAADYVERYFDRYPGVKSYMDHTRQAAREQGHVETLFHRRLYLPEIKSRNAARRQYAERTAINAPMQGTAADIIKRAMISVDHWLQSNALDARLIMQVHDELV